MILIAIYIATYEFSRLIELSGEKFLKIPTYMGAFLIPYGFYLNNFKFFLLTVFIVSFTALCIKLLGDKPLESTFTTVGATFLSIFYVPFFLSFLYFLEILTIITCFTFLLLFLSAIPLLIISAQGLARSGFMKSLAPRNHLKVFLPEL